MTSRVEIVPIGVPLEKKAPDIQKARRRTQRANSKGKVGSRLLMMDGMRPRMTLQELHWVRLQTHLLRIAWERGFILGPTMRDSRSRTVVIQWLARHVRGESFAWLRDEAKP